MWNERSCVVVWTFFRIAFLWDWDENWPFPVLWPLWIFQICWHTECSTFTASSFSFWNNSSRIPSPTLALFVVMLSKAYLTSHSRMSGCRWVITPSWLSRSLRICLQCRIPRFDSWVGKIPWIRKWQPTPVFLPGESHGLAGYSPWGHKSSTWLND